MNYKTKANEQFLNKISMFSTIWIWPDENAVYKIENGTFIAETYWEYELLKGITSKSFHKKIKLNTIMNF
jgi:hypothetical protein